MTSDFIKQEYGHEIYAVTSPKWGAETKQRQPVMTSWIIRGEEKTLAVDSGYPGIPGFREYLESEFEQPVFMVNTHGHIDHMGCNDQFEEVYLHSADHHLLTEDSPGGSGYSNREMVPYKLKCISNNDLINLGKRTVQVLEIPGHTRGSIMLLDQDTGSLFSGDSVARRLLYGLSDWTPLSQFLVKLEELSTLQITKVFSMHDLFSLPGNQPEKMIHGILNNIESIKETWQIQGDSTVFLRISLGKEKDIDYLSFVMPREKIDEALADLKSKNYLK